MITVSTPCNVALAYHCQLSSDVEIALAHIWLERNHPTRVKTREDVMKLKKQTIANINNYIVRWNRYGNVKNVMPIENFVIFMSSYGIPNHIIEYQALSLYLPSDVRRGIHEGSVS